jgi:hypothetical protein
MVKTNVPISDKEHHNLVEAFLRLKRSEDPERFQEVANKYPTITPPKQQTLREREVVVGLLGLQPSALSPEEAYRHGFESRYDKVNE